MAFLAQGTERKEGFGALLLELSHGSAEERALRTHLKWTRDAGRGRSHMVLHFIAAGVTETPVTSTFLVPDQKSRKNPDFIPFFRGR